MATVTGAYPGGYAEGYGSYTALVRELWVEFDAGTWTDVTADMVEVSTRRGRNRESGAFETGTMTFTLRNDTRVYDPDNAAGPYYGKLRPNRRARFRATYNGLIYPIWQGYVDSIAQNYGGPNDATAEFACSDLFKILNRVELPASVYAGEVTADTPTYWWRLDEASGSTAVTAVTGEALTAFGAPALGATTPLVRDPGSAYSAADTVSGFAATRQGWLPAGLRPITLEAFIVTTAANGTAVAVGDAGDGIRFRLGVSGGFAAFEAAKTVGGATSTAFASSAFTINDGTKHHLVGIYTAGGFPDMSIYVDGVFAGTGDIPPVAGAGGTQEVLIGNAGAGYSVANRGDGLVGTVDEVAVYDNAMLPAGRAAAHNTAGRTPWTGDTSGARLNRIAGLAGLVSSDLQLDAGSTTLQATSLGGSALGYAQKVEETEAGRLFVSNDGRLTFISRYNADLGTYLTSIANLVDADSGGALSDVRYMSVSADVDESRIVTRATVSREGSVAVTYSDAAAIAEFKPIDETHDGLLHNNDAYSLYYAQWIVNTHRTPATWVGAITLELMADPVNTYPQVLPMELGRRVTYMRKPQNVGAVMTLPMRIEAIEHSTGNGYWRTRLQLSPFNRGQGGYGTGVWDTSVWDQATWGL